MKNFVQRPGARLRAARRWRTSCVLVGERFLDRYDQADSVELGADERPFARRARSALQRIYDDRGVAELTLRPRRDPGRAVRARRAPPPQAARQLLRRLRAGRVHDAPGRHDRPLFVHLDVLAATPTHARRAAGEDVRARRSSRPSPRLRVRLDPAPRPRDGRTGAGPRPRRSTTSPSAAENRLWDTAQVSEEDERVTVYTDARPPFGVIELSSRPVIIPRRYNGPPDSANGGYACGLLAALLGRRGGGDAPPAAAARHGAGGGARARRDGVELRHDDAVVAEGCAAGLELEVPAPVSVEEAEQASKGYAGFRTTPIRPASPAARSATTVCGSSPGPSRAATRRLALDARGGRRARDRLGCPRLPERLGRGRLPARRRPPRAHGGARCACSRPQGSRTSSPAGPWPTTAASATRRRRSGRRTASSSPTPAPPGSSPANAPKPPHCVPRAQACRAARGARQAPMERGRAPAA